MAEPLSSPSFLSHSYLDSASVLVAVLSRYCRLFGHGWSGVEWRVAWRRVAWFNCNSMRSLFRPFGLCSLGFRSRRYHCAFSASNLWRKGKCVTFASSRASSCQCRGNRRRPSFGRGVSWAAGFMQHSQDDVGVVAGRFWSTFLGQFPLPNRLLDFIGWR